MNNLPNSYVVKDTIRDELRYHFCDLYGEKFYDAPKEKQMHYIAIILEVLSDETNEWEEE
jgi:hypothetical protein